MKLNSGMSDSGLGISSERNRCEFSVEESKSTPDT